MEHEEFIAAKKGMKCHSVQLTKLYNRLEKDMLTCDVDTVTSLFNKLCDRFEQFQTSHFQCLELCDVSEEVTDLESQFNSCQKNFVEFRERYLQWKLDKQAPDDNDKCSVVSVASVRTSVSSHISKQKSARTKRLIEEHRLKKLKEKLEMDMKKQIFEQECRLEEARIEDEVWNKATDETDEPPAEVESPTDRQTNGGGSDSVNKTDCTDRHNDLNNHCDSENKSTSNGKSEMFVTSNSVREQVGKSKSSIPSDDSISISSMDLAFHRLAKTLKEGLDLPKPELLIFRGNPVDYCKFIKNFETNIEARVNDDSLRLSYLIQHCKDEARCSIEDCVQLEPTEGYKRARSILYSRYGRPHVIARNYIESLVYGPALPASDVSSLSKLSLEMEKCEITLSQLGFVSDIDNTENLRRIVKRLPMHLRVKWADFAHNILESGREPRFKDLARFVDEKSRVASSMYGIDLVKEKPTLRDDNKSSTVSNRQQVSGSKITTLSTQGKNVTQKGGNHCSCCSGSCQELSQCQRFKSMPLGERTKLVKKLRVCFNCLRPNHFSNRCRRSNMCTVPDCTVKHHELLHSWVSRRDEQTVTHPSVNCASVNTNAKNCLGIVPVIVKGSSGISCETYALLDDGSDKTLCDERLLDRLHVESKPVTYEISTVSSSGSIHQGHEIDLEVQSVKGGDIVDLRGVWSVKRLSVSSRSAATKSDICRLPYLGDIELPDVHENDVMLLIGTDSPDSHIPLEVRHGSNSQPYAVRTRLGWTVRGPVFEERCYNQVSVNFQESRDLVLQEQLERMWNADFNDKVKGEKTSMSVEDRRALDMMESSISLVDGHYKLGLPWRDDHVTLPNNVSLAHARLQQLKRKLSRDPDLLQMYITTMNDYIDKGYATEVSEPQISGHKTWYLPHHPVVNPNKPGKVRVVFDCAAKFQNVSLNSNLLRGPDLMNSLVGVILRFRQGSVAIAADVEAMFHQVRVTDSDCDALRFLWWPQGNIQGQPKVYQMRVHLFGATSSPSCTAFALKRTASDNASNYKPDVISTIERNFYVDDCLKSTDTVKQAADLASDLRSLLKQGGFRLTKWVSNNRSVLDTIPVTERAPSLVSIMPDDILPSERALGILWDTQDDMIKFKVTVANKPLTRRGILSIVSAIFDPLGLVSPITLKAKAIVQRTFRDQLQWDDPLPDTMKHEWENWLSTLPSLERVLLNRCYKPADFGKVTSTQLHIFSDGSENGYGACAYLRLTNTQNDVACSLLMGKSRVAPMKTMTIPRLELCGAVVACRLYAFIDEELELPVDQVTFWTDSTIVLGYICNETRRFKTFVGNRISEIRDTTSPDQWRHVDTDSNPADIASRGLDVCDPHKLHRWLYGPNFLSQEAKHWPQQSLSQNIPEDDVETKKEISINASSTSYVIGRYISYFSSWPKLVRCVAWLSRYQKYCKNRYTSCPEKCPTGPLTLSELRNSAQTVLQHVQRSHFADEMQCLEQNLPVKGSSCLKTLNPTLIDGLIKVDGRLNNLTTHNCPVVLLATTT